MAKAKREPTEPNGVSMISKRDPMIDDIHFRIHVNDKAIFKKILTDDRLTIQTFCDACIQSYLRADPAMARVLSDWRKLNLIPKEHLEKYTFSKRERQDILKELEQSDTEQTERTNDEEDDAG